jgi:preprotein translocase subunit SecD
MSLRPLYLLLLVLATGCTRRLDPAAPHVELVYGTTAATLDETVTVLRRRLRAMEVTSRIEKRADSIVVMVGPDADLATIQRVLGRRARIEIVLVDDSAEAQAALAALPPPPGVRFETTWDWTGADAPKTLATTSPEALQPLMALVPKKWRLVSQRLDTVSGRPRYETLLVAPDSSFDNDSIASADEAFDDKNQPVVEVLFTPSAAPKLGELTTANVGRRMAIMLDGLVQVAPRIAGPIPEGRVQIQIPGDDPRQRRGVVRDIVAVLRVGALPAPIQLMSVDRRSGATR